MKEPTPAQQRLWRARILTELKNGTPVEETNRIMNEMIEAWQTVEGNTCNMIDDPMPKRQKNDR